MKTVRSTLLLIVFVCLFAACEVGGIGGESPDAGAKEWLQALASLDGLKLDERTCNAQKQQLQQGALLYTAFSALGNQALPGQNIKIDVSEVKVATSQVSGDSATV